MPLPVGRSPPPLEIIPALFTVAGEEFARGNKEAAIRKLDNALEISELLMSDAERRRANV